MPGHPIEGLMNAAMENLKTMVDVNTIIGDPVETPDGSLILTVSKVGFGYAAGGSDYQTQQKSQNSSSGSGSSQPFGGGSAGGVSITPIAFLIVNSNGVKMLHLDESTHVIEKILEAAPQAMDKVNSILSNRNGSREKDEHQGGGGDSNHNSDAHTYQEKNQNNNHKNNSNQNGNQGQ